MGRCASYTKLIILLRPECAQFFRKRSAASRKSHLHYSSFEEFLKHLFLRITRLRKGSLTHPKFINHFTFLSFN